MNFELYAVVVKWVPATTRVFNLNIQRVGDEEIHKPEGPNRMRIPEGGMEMEGNTGIVGQDALETGEPEPTKWPKQCQEDQGLTLPILHSR